METAPLKSFATWARTSLIREVSARIAAVLAPASRERVERPGAVAALERAVTEAGGGAAGRAAVADKVAYTWFNRLIALRFMDANGYTGIGVVSPPHGSAVGQPEILAEAKRGNIDSAVVSRQTLDTVTGLLNETRGSDDRQGETYALLLAEYCRYWNRAMPFMFEREGDYTELLVPADMLAHDSVLARSVTALTPEVCKDVEVIGWLYQFYISERKDEVFAGFKKNKKAGAAEIPAATQLFTPHWIVRYLVENSLGRLWLLNRPTSRLAERMDYYIAPVDEETNFLKVSSPEELKICDPACGSGHMLTYAFDLLHAIYEEEGYAPAEIPSLILANNLCGVEIDPRAGALAAFALTMKARARKRTFLARPSQPKIVSVAPVSVDPAFGADHTIAALATQFRDADVLGSLIQPEANAAELAQGAASVARAETLDSHSVQELTRQLIEQVSVLAAQYHVVITNPPYLGTRHMGDRLRSLAASRYPETKGDLCTMFLERSLTLLAPGGLAALVTSESWFFNTSFEATREVVSRRSRLRTAVCIDSLAFGVRLNTVATVLERGGAGAEAVFTRVDAEAIRSNRLSAIPVPGATVHFLPVERFSRVPGGVYAFDMPEAMLALYEHGRVLGDVVETRQGMATTDNDRFVRFWYEVSHADIGRAHHRGAPGNPPWVPYNKGGTPTRWWGNQEHIVRWQDEARELAEVGAKSIKQEKFFQSSVSWSNIGKGGARFRLYPPGFVFDVAGMSAFAPDDKTRLNLMGYLNAPLVGAALDVLAPTLNYQVGDVARLPLPDLSGADDDTRVREMVDLARASWAERETAHEFAANPLLAFAPMRISDAVATHLATLAGRSERLLGIERESGSYWSGIVADATGVAAGDPPAVVVRDGTAPTADGLVEDLVSYAVGCMFGRFSLDMRGLVLGNAGETLMHYFDKVPAPTFMPDKDNVIPIVDGDWFEDDIVARFRRFLRVAFGEKHFEENLRFVTEALGVKVLRDYFVKSFYKDHVQRYKKRPIYWLFSSPKGSFNALIYMHRYTPATVSTVLNEYLREYKAKLEASRQHHERMAVGAATPHERAAAQKEAERLRKVLLELDEYEHDVLYPLAASQIRIDLDDGVKANYPKFGAALKKIPGLEAGDE